MADMRDHEQNREMRDSKEMHDRGESKEMHGRGDVDDAGYMGGSGHSDRDDADRFRPDDKPRVAPLGDLGDFKVAEGFPDPRGWEVTGSDGQKIGKVHELIVDTGAMRTRYLDISLDKGAARGTSDRSLGDRSVLVPVGAARMGADDDRVTLDSIGAAELAGMPAYTHEPITREYEDSLLSKMPNRTPSATSAAASGDDYYKQSHFDDSQFFGSRKGRGTEGKDSQRVLRSEEELDIGKRQVQAGEVDVRKRVETEKVSQPVKVRREEVTIERRPIRGDEAKMAGGANISDSGETIRIPITEEEVVVQKRPVVKEEIVIKKHAVTDDKTVEADLRKERVDIDRDGMRGGGKMTDGGKMRDDEHMGGKDRPDAR